MVKFWKTLVAIVRLDVVDVEVDSAVERDRVQSAPNL